MPSARPGRGAGMRGVRLLLGESKTTFKLARCTAATCREWGHKPCGVSRDPVPDEQQRCLQGPGGRGDVGDFSGVGIMDRSRLQRLSGGDLQLTSGQLLLAASAKTTGMLEHEAFRASESADANLAVGDVHRD